MKKLCFLFLCFSFNLFAQEMIAINIALVPSKILEGQVQFQNARLYQENPMSFLIDENHLAHLSVLQMYVRPRDLDAIVTTLKDLKTKKIKMDVRNVELRNMTSDINQRFVDLIFATNPQLQKLQTDLVSKTKSYQLTGTKSAFIQPEIVKPEFVESVQNFVKEKTQDNYRPMITLGVTRATVLKKEIPQDQFAKNYEFEEIMIAQMGELGTARKVLAKIKLLP